MWGFFGTIAATILRFIFERMAKKKLSDREFIEYVSAHQKMRGRAGDASLEWDQALEEARKEMESENTKT